MKHRARARKLGRSTSHRLAMLRNMVTSLLDQERIRTTDAKAREVRRVADRMITLGKRGDLHARRRALRVIRRREVTAKVFDELAERYRDRPGGYTRVLKLGRRRGDAAPLAMVELVQEEVAAGTKPKASRKAATKKKAGGRKESAEAAQGGTAKKAASKKASAKKKTAKKASAGAAGKKTGKKATKKTAKKKTTKKKSSRKSD